MPSNTEHGLIVDHDETTGVCTITLTDVRALTWWLHGAGYNPDSWPVTIPYSTETPAIFCHTLGLEAAPPLEPPAAIHAARIRRNDHDLVIGSLPEPIAERLCERLRAFIAP